MKAITAFLFLAATARAAVTCPGAEKLPAACLGAAQHALAALDGPNDDAWASEVGYLKAACGGVLDGARAYLTCIRPAADRVHAAREPHLAVRAARAGKRLQALPGAWRSSPPKLGARKPVARYCGRRAKGRAVAAGCKSHPLYICVDHC